MERWCLEGSRLVAPVAQWCHQGAGFSLLGLFQLQLHPELTSHTRKKITAVSPGFPSIPYTIWSSTAQWKYNARLICDSNFSSSHILKKQKEKGINNSNIIFHLTQYMQNTVSMCNHSKNFKDIVYIHFILYYVFKIQCVFSIYRTSQSHYPPFKCKCSIASCG